MIKKHEKISEKRNLANFIVKLCKACYNIKAFSRFRENKQFKVWSIYPGAKC